MRLSLLKTFEDPEMVISKAVNCIREQAESNYDEIHFVRAENAQLHAVWARSHKGSADKIRQKNEKYAIWGHRFESEAHKRQLSYSQFPLQTRRCRSYPK